MKLDDAIDHINKSSDPLKAVDDVKRQYKETDAPIVIPWLEEMAAIKHRPD